MCDSLVDPFEQAIFALVVGHPTKRRDPARLAAEPRSRSRRPTDCSPDTSAVASGPDGTPAARFRSHLVRTARPPGTDRVQLPAVMLTSSSEPLNQSLLEVAAEWAPMTSGDVFVIVPIVVVDL